MNKADKYSSDEIYQILEGEIVRLKIQPGDMLSENVLSARFGVSRTIIRSALQRLAQNGFVEIIPYVGTRVTVIDLEAVTNFMYIRSAAETKVLCDFMKIATPPQIEEIRYKMNVFEEAVSGGDNTTLDTRENDDTMRKDLAFHGSYFHFLDKDILWQFLTAPHPNYSRFIRLDMLGGKNLPDVLREHRQIMQAIDDRNQAHIGDVITAHLYGGIRRLGPKLYSGEYKDYIRQKGNS